MTDKIPTSYVELGLGSGYPGDPVEKDTKPFTKPIFFGSPSFEEGLRRAHGQLDIAFSHRALARSLVTALGVPDILKTEGT